MSTEQLIQTVANEVAVELNPSNVIPQTLRAGAFFIASLDKVTGGLCLEEWSPTQSQLAATYKPAYPTCRYSPIAPPEVIL